jgi:sugar lactone lactonase YvrE
MQAFRPGITVALVPDTCSKRVIWNKGNLMSHARKALQVTFIMAFLSAFPLKATPIGQAETIALFNPGLVETPEGIAIDRQGNRYITLALTGEIRKVDTDGRQWTVAFLPIGQPLVPCGALPGLLGTLTLDDREDVLYVASSSCELENRGVFKVGLDGSTELLATLPADSLPNGITQVGRFLYVADAALPRVWRVSTIDGSVSLFVTSSLLAAIPGVPAPAANGIQYFRGDLYVAASAQSTIVRIPLRFNGSAGTPRIHASLPFGCDDFAFDVLGRIYCTTDPANRLTRTSADGRTTEILLDASDLLDGPTAVAFGRRGFDRLELYIANAAFPFFTTTFRPSLMRVFIGVPGAR